ncbi:MAG: hypothetical protein RL156_1698 [Bacteroidota bacterium]|jgi:hypothetical protein
MSTIVTRAGKGSALTYAEVDSNFTNLNTDKYQSGSAASLASLTLASALPVLSGGTGVTSSTGSGAVVLSVSPALVTPALGTPTSGNFSTGTFTWPTFNQNTTGQSGNVANALTIGTGLSGASYNGSSPVTISIDGTVATLSGTQTLTNKTISGANNTLSNIGNSSLLNSSVTIGTTSVALGATSTTISGLNSVTLTADPTSALQVATKQYVDAAVSNTNYHAASSYATTADLGSVTYNNGSSGIGATLTNAGTQAALVVDGYTMTAADVTNAVRILVKNQSIASQNGIYVLTNQGSVSTNWVLTRATDFDQVGTGQNEVAPGDITYILKGTINANTQWVQTTDFPITIGTTSLVFVQVASPSSYTAGTGLTLTGTQFSLTSPVTAALGGTGQTSYTVGDLLYANTATSLAKLADVATGNSLISGGVGVAPSWGKIGLTTHVSGTLPVANGGTGLTAGTSGGVLYYSDTGTLASSAVLTANALMVGGGAGAAPSTITTGTGVITALGVNTGTAGAFVVNGGALGTPSSGTLTSCTGLPISTGVSGLGTGIDTFLATPSSANLAAAVTDETGSGSLVFANTPSLTTPNIGAATGTSLAATGGTVLVRAAATQDGVQLQGRSGGTSSYSVTLTPTTLTASRTITLADGNTTLQAGTMATTGGTLAQFSPTTSSQLAGVISDETGSGALVFGTSPTIATPTITTSATVPLIIGGTGTTSALRLRSTSGVGAAGADIIFQTGNNGATEAMRILNNGNIGIGTTNPVAVLESANSSGGFNFGSTVSISTADGPAYFGRKSRGSLTVPTAVLANDTLTYFTAGGYTGTAWTASRGYMSILASQNWTGTANGTDIAFFTTPTNTTSVSEKLRIKADGNVGIGTSSPSSKLDVVGSICSNTTTYPNFNYNADYRITFGENFAPPNETGSVVQFGSGVNTKNMIFAFSKTNVNTSFFGNDGSKMVIGSEGSLPITFRTGLDYYNTDILNSGTQRVVLDSNGNFLITSSGGLGYGTGSGGAVTQITSRTTGVTLNKTNGAITLVSAAGTTAWTSFTVTNNTVATTDTVIIGQKSGANLYEIHITAVSAGSFRVSFRTTGGTTTEQPVFNFSVIKAVTS